MRFIRFLLISTFFATASFSLSYAQDTIWQSATKGDVDAIKGFIDAGADLDEPSKTGSAPLHYAVARNRVEVVALLLDADADPDVEDSRQRTPLDLAVSGKKMEIADLLLDADAFVEAPTTLLNDSVWWGNLLEVKLHIYAGTDLEQEDADGCTAVMNAAYHQLLDILKLLIEHEADLSAGDKAERTALDWAIIVQFTEGEELLRENDAPSGAEKSFIAAIQTGNIEAVKTLLDAGADVNEPAYTTKTPLHYAAHSISLDVLKLLISSGADLEARTEQGYTPLMYTGFQNSADNCRVLLEAGANPNTLDVLWQWSPLDHALDSGASDVVKVIREAGGVAGPRMTMHEAAYLGNNKNVGVHLFFGTDINLLDDIGETPLDAAARGRKHNTVAFLKTQTRVEFATDENGQQVFRVVGPYGTGNRAPLLGFAIETSINLSDWESAESVDTEDGVGVLKFEPDPEVPARFFRVAVNELEE